MGNTTGIDLTDVTQLLKADLETTQIGIGTDEMEGVEGSAPIIQLANRIIEDAYISGSSDIHIEPQEEDLLVRSTVPVGGGRSPLTLGASSCTWGRVECRLAEWTHQLFPAIPM